MNAAFIIHHTTLAFGQEKGVNYPNKGMNDGLRGVGANNGCLYSRVHVRFTKNKQGIQPAFASLCRASLPSLTRCSPLKLGLGSLSFFHLGKTLQALDFTVRLLL
ncbi:hypothetical protein V6N13_061205 [Hibiscus sabdariffa]